MRGRNGSRPGHARQAQAAPRRARDAGCEHGEARGEGRVPALLAAHAAGAVGRDRADVAARTAAAERHVTPLRGTFQLAAGALALACAYAHPAEAGGAPAATESPGWLSPLAGVKLMAVDGSTLTLQ